MHPVTYALDDNGIATITMNDGKVNALSPTMLAALNEALDQASIEAAAVILTGRPGCFSAGFDLKVMASSPKAATNMVLSGGALFLRLYEFSLPVVAAITGHALAGGVLLAASTDTRLGIRGDFKLGLNEVETGLPVPILAHEFARDRLSPRYLTQAVVQAQLYNPIDAQRVGWLDEVVDAESLQDSAQQETQRLSKLDRHAYGVSKQSLRRKSIEYMRQTMKANIEELLGEATSSEGP